MKFLKMIFCLDRRHYRMSPISCRDSNKAGNIKRNIDIKRA